MKHAFKILEIYFSACEDFRNLGKDFRAQEILPSLAIQFKSAEETKRTKFVKLPSDSNVVKLSWDEATQYTVSLIAQGDDSDQTVAIAQITTASLKPQNHDFITLTKPSSSQVPVCSLLIYTSLEAASSPTTQEASAEQTQGAQFTEITTKPSPEIKEPKSQSPQHESPQRVIPEREIQHELSRVSIESEQAAIHTIQDLECQETIDTCLTQDIFSRIQYKTTTEVVQPRLLSDFEVSEESDLEQLKCSEVYPCHLNSNLTIYSDISSYQEPSDISEGELGINKENLPKFMSAMGTQNFNQRNVNFATHSYASPIAKTKMLKNAFLSESGDKATTCSQIQSSRCSKGNTPQTLCVKSARPHFQKKLSIKQRRDSILRNKGSLTQRRSSNFSQKQKQTGVHVVERGKVLFADTYKKKPKGVQTPIIKSMTSKPSPVKFPNTQGSFYLSKNRSKVSNLVSHQKPSAYRNLFGGGGPTAQSSNRGKRSFLKKVEEEQLHLPLKLLNLETRQKQFFGSRPDTQRQFKDEPPRITEIDQNCEITLRVSTASNLSTNNSVTSRQSNINRPTAQFGDQSRLLTEQHSGPFQPAIEPEMLIPIHKRRGGGLSKPRAAVCTKKKTQIQSTGNSPFKHFQESPLQDLSNGYRYSFSFQKYKKNQSRLI